MVYIIISSLTKLLIICYCITNGRTVADSIGKLTPRENEPEPDTFGTVSISFCSKPRAYSNGRRAPRCGFFEKSLSGTETRSRITLHYE